MGYPNQYPPQFGHGGGMPPPPRPVSGTPHALAMVVGVLFTVCVFGYLTTTVEHLGSAPVYVVLTFLMFAVTMLAAGGGTVMLILKMRVGAFILSGAVGLFYLTWLILLFSSGAPGPFLQGMFGTDEGWQSGLPMAFLLGVPAVILALMPPTQGYLKQAQAHKSGQRPYAQVPYPQQAYGQQPYGQPPQPSHGQHLQPPHQPPYGQPPTYHGQHGQQPPQW